MSIDKPYLDLFERLIAPIHFQQFTDTYLEKASLHIKRNDPAYYNLLGIHEMDALLRFGFPTEGNQDLMAAKVVLGMQGEQKFLLDSRERDYWAKLVNLHATGHTILYNFVHHRHPGIFKVAKAIELFLGGYTYANLFHSPNSGEQGFAFHIDAQELFVLHLEGRKRWQIYKPQFELPTPALSAPPIQYDQLENPLEVVLEPGDLLYIPRGFIHAVQGMDGPALHLTVATEVPRMLDLLIEAILVAAQRDLELRRGVPLLGKWAEFAHLDSATLAGLLSHVASNCDPEVVMDRVRGNIIARTVPAPDGYFTRIQSQPKPDTLYSRRAGLLWAWTSHLNSSGNQTQTLRFSGNVVTVSEPYKELLEAICTLETFKPIDLPGEFPIKEKLAMVHRLVIQGFLTECEVESPSAESSSFENY